MINFKKPRCVYWAHSRNSDPSKIFKTKKAAIAWARSFFNGIYIVEPIDKEKLSERLIYLKNKFNIYPDVV